MRKTLNFSILITAVCCGLVLSSCIFNNKKKSSRTTGWNYNDSDMGGFSVVDAVKQDVGPGLVLIEGGAFVMGNTEDNVYYDWNNNARQVTVTSFYLDQTEVRNVDYLEYLYWIDRIYGSDYPEVKRRALPDTLVWRSSMSYNEPMVGIYLRHPSYHEYPVVGVNWQQACDYAQWRGDRVNEKILIEAGVLAFDPDQNKDSNFNTDAYLAGQYVGIVDKGIEAIAPKGGGTITRNAKMEDGLLLPKYRLPTEAEWEYAALGLIGNTEHELISDRRVYPWNNDGLRTQDDKYYGTFTANFKRNNGDYMGVAGNLNDGAAFPAPVTSYLPNDYGLYNMAGNVSEWVLDVYRPMSFDDFADYNPFRGNEFKAKTVDSLGNITYVPARAEEIASRKNYRNSYNLNYNDGDNKSTIQSNWLNSEADVESSTKNVYDYGVTTLISDKSRVFKGGSWADGPYFLSPSIRRFLDEDQASSTIGFRCAMSKIGGASAK